MTPEKIAEIEGIIKSINGYELFKNQARIRAALTAILEILRESPEPDATQRAKRMWSRPVAD